MSASPLPFCEIYADESSQTKHRYLAIGAVVLEKSETAKVCAKINKERALYSLIDHEIKWAKVSAAKIQGYIGVINEFFAFMAQDVVHFHALTVDTSTFDHKTHNKGDREAGFNKLIYQLLLHKVGRKYGLEYRFEAYLDHRKTNQDPETMRKMLNSALARDYGIQHHPFRSIVFQDSNEAPLIQVCDLIVGAIAYRKNGWHKQDGASPSKCRLAEHIARKVMAVQPHTATDSRSHKFTYWQFSYRKK